MAHAIHEPAWLTYHLVPVEEWDAVPQDTPYYPTAFPQDGFIHTSHTAAEAAAAGNRYYTRDARPYYALAVDLRRLTSPWRYDGDARFPHVYGPLNHDAVMAAPTAPRLPDGTFLPPTWADPTYPAEDIPFTTPKVGVNAVIFSDAGQVLLTQREDNRLWCLPGGHVDLGETIAEAVVRETREETGLIVETGRVIGVYSDPHNALRIGQGLRYQMVLISVECRLIGGTLSRSDETLDEGWFDPDDLPPLVPSHYQRIADARAGGETVLR
jgi:ADP-ribose pyrophosphatase YjhB (NUDIX family)/uncharacterized protein (DUF952 family)